MRMSDDSEQVRVRAGHIIHLVREILSAPDSRRDLAVDRVTGRPQRLDVGEAAMLAQVIVRLALVETEEATLESDLNALADLAEWHGLPREVLPLLRTIPRRSLHGSSVELYDELMARGAPISRDYQTIPGLEWVVLEDSYVLDISLSPGSADFRLDVVLTPEHTAYQPPAPDEVECYRRGGLRFSQVTRAVWQRQGARPARDATGEIDYGNIDSLSWDSGTYLLEGDFGRLELEAGDVALELDGAGGDG